jgi:hypothetical protein
MATPNVPHRDLEAGKVSANPNSNIATDNSSSSVSCTSSSDFITPPEVTTRDRRVSSWREQPNKARTFFNKTLVCSLTLCQTIVLIAILGGGVFLLLWLVGLTYD